MYLRMFYSGIGRQARYDRIGQGCERRPARPPVTAFWLLKTWACPVCCRGNNPFN